MTTLQPDYDHDRERLLHATRNANEQRKHKKDESFLRYMNVNMARNWPWQKSSPPVLAPQVLEASASEEVISSTWSRPGSFAIRGPGATSFSSNDSEGGDERDGYGDENDAGANAGDGGAAGIRSDRVDNPRSAPSPIEIQAEAYVVVEDDDLTRSESVREEIRREILAQAAEAQVIDSSVATKSDRNPRKRRAIAVAIVALVAAAVAVGVAVPLSRRPTTGDARAADGELLASLTVQVNNRVPTFGAYVYAETRGTGLFNGSTITTGAFSAVTCNIRNCLGNQGTNEGFCIDEKEYEPGCCWGTACTEDSKCGDRCPPPPDSCYRTDPSDAACTRENCYACHAVDGEDVYVLNDIVVDIDCLNVGTAVRPENGDTYKWAIFCGPVVEGPIVEQNRDYGEYQCQAVRLGAGFTNDEGGLASANFPCQYIALLECGCGPSDIFTFGLPEPSGPCLPDGGCPFLCEDAGITHARNACRAFPGNISWWEGRNGLNRSLFGGEVVAYALTFDIYIKGSP
jgi:hypothetical protein